MEQAAGQPPGPQQVVAVDIGGTSMRAALVERDGTVSGRTAIRTEPANGFDDAMDRLTTLIVGVGEGAAEAGAIGISTAGPVDPDTGTYAHPPNLIGWHDRSLLAALAPRFSVPVVVGHDATLAAVAEQRLGAHRGASDLVYLTVSTGIGAGIIAGGRSVTGSRGGAGEAGHLIVDPGGRACGAGCPGCLEGVASGTAIAAEARERVAAGEETRLPARATAADVFAAAAAGDRVAAAIVDRALGHLATGLASLLAVLDPEALIIGGGMTPGLSAEWTRLIERTRERALPRYQDHVPVELTTLGDDVCLIGAAMVAFAHLDANRAAT